ncbi:MAG: MFS transporter [Pseudomonadota bacterium]
MMEQRSHKKWWILGAMGSVLGLVVLDETVVGVALPTLRADLGMSAATSHWVVNAYLLVFTTLAVAGGRLCEIFGMRRLFLAAVLLFGAASMACGFAPSGGWLIAARALQGVGAAVIFPASIAIITIVFPPEQRGLAFGLHTTVGGICMSLGPLVGGLFTEFISWRWIFWVNLPLVALVAGVILLFWTTGDEPEQNSESADLPAWRKVDWLGFFWLGTSLLCLVMAMMQAPDWGWFSPIIWALALAALPGFWAFWRREVALSKIDKTAPLVDFDLLKIPTFSSGCLMVFAAQFGKIAVIIFGALYIQERLKLSPLEAGLVLLATFLPTLGTSLFAGHLADRMGPRRPMILGAAIHGTALFALAAAALSDSLLFFLPAAVLWGAFMPFMFVPSRRGALNATPADLRGLAGGLSMTAQLLGGTVGMAFCGLLSLVSGSFAVVFIAAGLVVWVSVWAAWRFFEADAV